MHASTIARGALWLLVTKSHRQTSQEMRTKNALDDVAGNTQLSLSGGTDKGQDGIDNFFNTHTCSPMCDLLGLKPFGARAR